jgi:hypothetical protein
MTTILKTNRINLDQIEVDFKCPRCKSLCVFSNKFFSQLKQNPNLKRYIQEKYFSDELCYLRELFNLEESTDVVAILEHFSTLDQENKFHFWKLHSGNPTPSEAPRSLKVKGVVIKGLSKVPRGVFLRCLGKRVMKASTKRLLRINEIDLEEDFDDEE